MKGQGSGTSMMSGDWFNYHIDLDLAKIAINKQAQIIVNINTMQTSGEGN